MMDINFGLEHELVTNGGAPALCSCSNYDPCQSCLAGPLPLATAC